MRSLSHAQLAMLAGEATRTDLDSTLLALVRADVLHCDGDSYQFSHPLLVDVLRLLLDEHEKRARYRVLCRARIGAHAASRW